MLKVVAEGWRRLKRQALVQACCVVVAAAIALYWGVPHGLAVLLSGLTLTIAHLVSARFALTDGVPSAAGAIGALVVSVVAKWVVVAVVLWLAIAVLRLPAIATLAGLIVALMAHVVGATRELTHKI
ncbi:hypothetical protein ACQQ2N_02670 [Dokdonella sp. MW10]|uniref:hypothetical protein n=1 Tax=Dokdonella sp. MW10 TaxID=2992926 RepID=UPI003F7EE73B